VRMTPIADIDAFVVFLGEITAKLRELAFVE
jgi:hypothetical protein